MRTELTKISEIKVTGQTTKIKAVDSTGLASHYTA
jgi:hypothetical protein